MNEDIAVNSTLKLVFGKSDYWYLNDDSVWEESSAPNISYFHCEETKKIALSKFWQNLACKVYQVDNCKYDGIASIEFEKKINKFKVNFNPLLFYQYIVYCGAVDGGVTKLRFSEVPFEKLVIDFEKHKSQMEKYGWNLEFYTNLLKDGWKNINCWKYWNNLLHKNSYVFDCTIYIFVHELMHLMWNHVSRMMASDDAGLWNEAADFAINQNLLFPMPLKKQLISQFSNFFWRGAQYSFLKHFERTDEIDIPAKIRKNLSNQKSFNENTTVEQIDKILDFNDNKYITNKNADFYFEILKKGKGAPENQQPGPEGDPKDGSGDQGDGESPGESENGDSKEGKDSKGSKTGINEVAKFFKHIISDGTGSPGEEKEENGDGSEDDSKFDEIIKKIEIDKIFKDSYKNSEDKIRKEKLYGKSEIPFAYALQERIDSYEKVKKDNRWKKELNRFVLSYMQEKEKDITMTRSSRKRPDIFPGMKRDIGLDIIFIIDTSGSIADADYKQFVGEIVNINKICELDKCRIIQCHTQVSKDDRKFSLKKIKSIKFEESGGTRMRSALELLQRENNRKPCVIFTDGLVDFFAAEEFQFKVLLFVTVKETVYDLTNRGFKVICPKDN
jgi:predicted metal-dependent peptidase